MTQTISINAGRDAKEIQVAGGNVTNAETTTTTWHGIDLTPQERAAAESFEQSAKAELSKPEPNANTLLTGIMTLGVQAAPVLLKLVRAWIGM